MALSEPSTSAQVKHSERGRHATVMQASFRHAHKPATCQESVAAAVSGHEAVHAGHSQGTEGTADTADGRKAHADAGREAAGAQAADAGWEDAAPDGGVLELVRHAGQHGVDVVDHAGCGRRARWKAPSHGGAQVGPVPVDDSI